jgi:hypothetical protein
MNSRYRFAASVFFSLLLAVPAIVKTQQPGARPTQAPTQKTPQKQSIAGTVVFAVNNYPHGATLDPIVIFNKGQYIDPLPDDEAFLLEVASKYMRAGQTHRVIFGGAEAGTITVGDRHEFGLTHGATLRSSIKLGGEVMALATASETLGSKQNTRRTPTPDERAAMMKLMTEAYRFRKAGPSAIAKVQINNITAIDVDSDGQAELIGSFMISDKNYNSWALFLMAEMKNGQYRPSLTWYHKGDEGTGEVRRLLDILDLDGDGVAEVFTMNGYYESSDFTIYKKVKGVWRSVYQGGGFGI